MFSADEQSNKTAGAVNAVIIFVTFLTSIPALALPNNRVWLRLQGWLVVLCSFFTLILGLFMWFGTLQTRKNLGVVWAQQPALVQSLLQDRVSRAFLFIPRTCPAHICQHLATPWSCASH